MRLAVDTSAIFSNQRRSFADGDRPFESVDLIGLSHRFASFPKPDALTELFVGSFDGVPREQSLPFKENSGHAAAVQSVANEDGFRATADRDQRRHSARAGEVVVGDDGAGFPGEANRHQLVVGATIVPNDAFASLPQPDAGLGILDALITDDERSRTKLGSDARHFILFATIVPDDRFGFFLASDTRHPVVVAVISFHNGARLGSGANANPGAPVVMTFVCAHHGR